MSKRYIRYSRQSVPDISVQTGSRSIRQQACSSRSRRSDRPVPYSHPVPVMRGMAALPKPTIPGTFRVPLRKPRSCPPPSSWAVRRTLGFFLLIYKAAHTFRTIDFMSGTGKQVYSVLLHVNRYFSQGLCRIRKKKNTPAISLLH